MTVLSVEGLHAGYGPTPVLFEVGLHVDAGQAVALLGRNGVGKTTLLRAVMGLEARTSGGVVRVGGTDMTAWPTHRRSAGGVQFIPENRGIFGDLTVRENLRLAQFVSKRRHAGRRWTLDEMLASFPILAERLDSPAGVLSGGERQILAVARALLAQPRLLLVDEFSEGLQRPTVAKLAALLRTAVDAGLALVLIDQDSSFAVDFADRICLMEKGSLVDEGPAKDFRDDPDRLLSRLAF